MIYFKFDIDGQNVTGISESRPTEAPYIMRRDLVSMDHARNVALKATEFSGDTYLPVDMGEGCYPRFDVIKVPKVGDKVSYGFNGDYYPDGEIVSISPTFVITTSSGKKYRLRGTTGVWKQTGGTWSLVGGHHDERNPSF